MERWIPDLAFLFLRAALKMNVFPRKKEHF